MKKTVLILAVLFLVSCGYRFAGQESTLPGGLNKIAMPEIVNQSAEPFLENILASYLSEEVGRNPQISEVDQPEAEAILYVTILGYSSQALSYDSQDDIAEYRSELRINARFVSSDDLQPLWQGDLSWTGEYVAAEDKISQEDNERRTIEEISGRLAEELLFRLYQVEPSTW